MAEPTLVRCRVVPTELNISTIVQSLVSKLRSSLLSPVVYQKLHSVWKKASSNSNHGRWLLSFFVWLVVAVTGKQLGICERAIDHPKWETRSLQSLAQNDKDWYEETRTYCSLERFT